MTGTCSNETLKEELSPNKLFKAIVFKRDCGATTGLSVQVMILKSTESLKSDLSGNIFIIDGNHAEAPITDTNVSWITDRELLIRYPQNARTFKMEKNLNGIRIVYENF